MKKLVTCIILILCISTCALADHRDDLIDIIDRARLLLTMFYPPVAEGSVLYEDVNVKMTAISQPYFEEGWSHGDADGAIYIDVVIENYTGDDILCVFPEIAVNGWVLDCRVDEVMAKKKIQTSLKITYLANTDLMSLEDIETIEGVFSYVSTNSWKVIGSGEFYWIFNVDTNIYDEPIEGGTA